MAIRCGTWGSPCTPIPGQALLDDGEGAVSPAWMSSGSEGLACKAQATAQTPRTGMLEASRNGSTLRSRLKRSWLSERARLLRAAVIAHADPEGVRLGGVADRDVGARLLVRVARDERPRRAQRPVEAELEAAVAPLAADDVRDAIRVDGAQRQPAGDARRHHPRPRDSKLVARGDEPRRIGAHASLHLGAHRRALAALVDREAESRRVIGAS